MKPLAAIAAAGALGALAVLSWPSSRSPAPEQPAVLETAESVLTMPETKSHEPIKATRAALLESCPEPEAEDNPCASCSVAPQGAICLTTEEPIDGELGDDQAKDPRLWVCPADGDHLETWTTWSTSPAVPAPGCRLAIPPSRFGGVSMTGLELDEQRLDHLRNLCKPCPIAAGRWGPCPRCWFDGDCAERCPVEEQGPSD